jgi:hypothetical protein
MTPSGSGATRGATRHRPSHRENLGQFGPEIDMCRTSHPARRTITLAAALVSLVALTTPSLAVTDSGRRVDHEARSRGVAVPDTDDNDPPADPRRRQPHLFNTPRITGSGRDTKSSALLTDPKLRYPPDSPHLDYSPWVANPSPREQSSSTIDGSLEYTQIALGGLAGVAIAAAVAGMLCERRRRQPLLEAALASSDSDELPRAAGLLGDLFAQQSRIRAAEHAYRAAIDVGDEYWSPIAQATLADLLSGQGQRAEAQVLLEAVIASGHPRAVPAAQASLAELLTSRNHTEASGTTSLRTDGRHHPPRCRHR